MSEMMTASDPAARPDPGAPRLRASFDLDSEGHPQFTEDGDLRHYQIRLWVENAPSDTYAVTYQLDPSYYYDAIREVRDAGSQFAQELTSYGDYVVQARVRARSRRWPLAERLARLLDETYPSAEELSPAIAAAIADIQRY